MTDRVSLLCILGPTAIGKTRIAALVGAKLNGEIISADSRQVYRGLTIGTGKDLDAYQINNRCIPYHLIDIVDPDREYNVFRFQQDCYKAYEDIRTRSRLPILCGGTGLYLDAILSHYQLIEAPPDPALREQLQLLTKAEQIAMLGQYQKLHNITDTEAPDRLLRALEVAILSARTTTAVAVPPMRTLVLGLTLEWAHLKQRISARLKERLEQGLVAEVAALLNQGLSAERLLKLGLEYRYVTQYLLGQVSFELMQRSLTVAIQDFAKRQRKWFSRMERRGVCIHWLDASQPAEEVATQIVVQYQHVFDAKSRTAGDIDPAV